MYKGRKNKLTVQQKAEELIEHTIMITDNTNNFSKGRRFTFVDRMQNRALDIHEMIVEANELPVKDRKPMQRLVMAKIESLIALIEISYKRKFINGKQCYKWAGIAIEVKKLTAAWMYRTK